MCTSLTVSAELERGLAFDSLCGAAFNSLWSGLVIVTSNVLSVCVNCEIRQSEIALKNPNPETRTNPSHDCNPGLHFC